MVPRQMVNYLTGGMMAVAKINPISVARMRVERANGNREVIYSVEKVPVRDLRRWLKLRAHLAGMRREDRKDGW